MAERALPEIKSRLTIDDSDLKRVATNAEVAAAKVDASFASTNAASEQLSLGLAQVDKGLAQTAIQSGTAAGSLAQLDEAYGVSSGEAKAFNATLSGTAVAATKATAGLETTDVALAQTAGTAGEATAALAGTNAALISQTGATAANTAAQQANTVATATAGEVLNNASTAAGAVASSETRASRTARDAALAHTTFADKLSKASKELGGLGDAGVVTAQKLTVVDKVIGTGGTLPLGMTATIAGLAAVYLGFRQIQSGVSDYLQLADAVRTYTHVTGESAEVASRQVEAFQRLGVDGDTATTIMVKFARAIEMTPAKLNAMGVAIAHTSDGNVDVARTLYNAIDAWNRTGDAVERDNIMFTAFGKNGRALLPILEAGSKQLQEFEANAKLVLTQGDLDQARKYTLQTRELSYQFQILKDNLGKAVVPALSAVIDKGNENRYVIDKLKESGMNEVQAELISMRTRDQQVSALRRQYQAAQEARKKNDELTNSLKEQAAASAAAAQAADDLASAQLGEADAAVAIRSAQLALARADDAVKQAQVDLTAAIKDYGAKSPQAHDATLSLSESMLSQFDAVKRLASAQVELASKQADAAGAALSAKAKHDLLIADLQVLANQLAPNSPLRVQLDNYINDLNKVPNNVYTNLWAQYRYSTQGSPPPGAQPMPLIRARQGGGEMIPGSIYTIGESGREAYIPDRPGRVLPHGATMKLEDQIQRLVDQLGNGGSSDLRQTNRLLQELLGVVASAPSGQTGVAAALYKAMQGAGLNRLRGMAGA